jgi:hypothetical protein
MINMGDYSHVSYFSTHYISKIQINSTGELILKRPGKGRRPQAETPETIKRSYSKTKGSLTCLRYGRPPRGNALDGQAAGPHGAARRGLARMALGRT